MPTHTRGQNILVNTLTTLSVLLLCALASQNTVWGQTTPPAPASSPADAPNAKDEGPAMATLFGGADFTNGGYGALGVGGTRANAQGVGMTGFRGGWLINHTWLLGLGGNSTALYFKGDPDSTGVRKDLSFGYGGLLVEYIPAWDSVFHPAFGILSGSGTVSTRTQDSCMGNTCTYTLPEMDRVTVLELSARLEVNLFRYMRAGLGAGYHRVWGLSYPYLQPDSLNSGSVQLYLIFGKF